LFIQSGFDQKWKVFNTKGQIIGVFNLNAGETYKLQPEIHLPDGIIILANGNNRIKVVYR
jgi:hypothetical protein